MKKEKKVIDETLSPEELKKQKKKKQKKIILITFVVMVLFAAIYMVALLDLDVDVMTAKFFNLFEKENTETRYLFYPTDYSENIFTDPGYMDLNRNVSYERNGVTYLIEDENYSDYGEGAEFFGEYFACVISGDVDGYNELFTKKYYKLNEPKEMFTMQKIYDIHVKFQSSENKNGDNFYYYVVKFKIRRNNGSLFMDRDSDSSRPLAFVLTDREGTLKIDKILEYEHQVNNSR
ncbi:MAG: hypothetical protein IKT70_06870 [Clostridia bacterium]|nr:hypothetical protein [Clostridia bacterium]